MFSRPRKSMSPHERVGLPPGSLIPVGVRSTEPVKIRVIRYNQKDFEEKEAAAIEECLRPQDRKLITWINVDGLQDTDIVEKIGTHFDIHPLVLEDMLNTEQRPKTDDYDDYVFTVLKSLRYDENEDEFTAAQISLVLGPHYVLSLCQEEIRNFNPVLERLKKLISHFKR